VDEAGRGCLAGPLAVGISIFHKNFFLNPLPDELQEIDDSKKIPPAKREFLLDSIKKHASYSCVVQISNRWIDKIGINPATEYAIIRGLLRAQIDRIYPEKMFLDGNFKFKNIPSYFPDLDYQSIKSGDSRVFSIAAASILAKVTRDRRMKRYNRFFPGYDLDLHKGYGTKSHRESIKKNGLSPIHRKSYTLKS